MTKHFSLTIAAEEALDNVDKRQRSRFVSDAIIAHAKKKDIFSNYNTDKNKISVPAKAAKKPDNSGASSTEANNDAGQEDNQIQFDKDF